MPIVPLEHHKRRNEIPECSNYYNHRQNVSVDAHADNESQIGINPVNIGDLVSASMAVRSAAISFRTSAPRGFIVQ